MPLKISLRPHEKLFLSGAVVVNGDARAELTILNSVPVMRERDVLTEEKADTPCKRIYFVVQLMYMDPPHLAEYRIRFLEMVGQLAQSKPELEPVIEALVQQVSSGDYYQALKSAKGLIKREQELVENAD
jgi:flagellar biosynthesis repressor protein FlbT